LYVEKADTNLPVLRVSKPIPTWKYPMNKSKNRALETIKSLGPRMRVHVGSDMSNCYQELSEIYDNASILKFNSGDQSNGWHIPPAWEVSHAVLKGPDGKVIADWNCDPLCLFTYSPAFSGKVSREELEPHLFTAESNPTATPYHFRNQYRHWDPEWGFCLPFEIYQTLGRGSYHVDIETRFEPGTLDMVEQVHSGEFDESILFVGHFDHPFMYNDGLSGCIAGHEAISALEGKSTKLSYRMLSTVEIIGSAFYCRDHAKERGVQEALFIAASAAEAELSYANSFHGNNWIDKVVKHVLQHNAPDAEMYDFRQGDLGNDETAFDVEGIDIPCGSLMRAPIPYYHTNQDDFSQVNIDRLTEVVSIVSRVINVFENNSVLVPKFRGLPCLSHPDIDLYISPGSVSGNAQSSDPIVSRILGNIPPELVSQSEFNLDSFSHLMTVLPRLCDGKTSVLEIAEHCNLPFEVVSEYTDMWVEKSLLEKVWINPFSGSSQ
jgi:aminopeptidase-like protein